MVNCGNARFFLNAISQHLFLNAGIYPIIVRKRMIFEEVNDFVDVWLQRQS